MTLFLLLLTACLPDPTEDSGYRVLADEDGDGWADDDDCAPDDATVHPAAPELCDGLDNDCDDAADEAVTSTFYADADADGHGDPDTTTTACTLPADHSTNATDCDDTDPATHPTATEICDGADNDCDELTDENLALAWYADGDGDGYGDPDDVTETCTAGSGRVANGTDCDDAAPETHPGATELCDAADNDCDGDADEDTETFYADLDADGFGDPDAPTDACDQPSGHTTDATDCDDTAPETHPGADELCDSLDNDCDGTADEDAVDALTLYTDADGDGFGDGSPTTGCSTTPTLATDDGDCDDADATVHPGATESCNDADDDCDGDADEALATTTFHVDADGDGYGDPDTSLETCHSTPSGTTLDDTDCDDTDASIHPDALDLPYDGVDADCAGDDDHDTDGDGFQAEPTGLDCDDTDPTVNPDATETWYDGTDQDCDGNDDDADGDGFTTTDCDDSDATVHPDATETWYDGTDQDCDGNDDDADGDGFPADTDCDDQTPDAHPDATETWYDRVDQDCAGDDDFDADGDGDRSIDHEGGDCDDQNAERASTLAEVWYDGVDQDCDSNDTDQDGDGDPSDAYGGGDCDDTDPAVASTLSETWYDGVDADCAGDDDYDADADGHQLGDDCDDDDPDISPDATETWYDGVDQDCAGDDDYDADADGHSPTSQGGNDCDDTDPDVSPDAAEVWYDGTDQDCDGADDDQDGDGYLLADDCDDTEAATHPGATEICQNGIDDDCDGTPSGCSLLGQEVASILAGATLTGEQDGDDAGAALDVGDLDGDGYADLVTAGPGADLAWVVYGPLSSTSLDAAELRLVGDGASLGADVTLLGDVDDDGLDEAAVTGPDATSGAGTVCLLDADDLGDLAQADAWCLDGDGADELFSAAPADGGLLVGVPGRKSSAGATEGGARLLPGPLDATSDLADAWLLAGLGNTATGEAVTAADVDGDGYDDLLIGAPDDDSGATNAGSVFLVLGPLSADLDLGDADLRIDGPNRSAFLGQEGALAAPGDLDDDGYDDLLAGLRGADAQDGSTTDNGRVLVLLGTPSPAWTLEADAVIEGDEDEELGGRVAGAGDVDADGQLDVVVGGPESDVDDTNAGRAWLVYGSTWSGTLAADDLVITNTTSGDAFGTVAAGDVTGDGTDDLVVGASGYDSDRGAIYLFVGGGI